MKFSAEYRVDTHDTDLNGIASATSVMQYIQETANLQHEAFGPTMDELRASGKAFVLSRCALDILLPLRAQDRLRAESWLCEAKGYGYFRNCLLYRDGELAASMAAFWGVIDIASRKPLRAEEVSLGFGTDEQTLQTAAPVRFRIPKELTLAPVGEHTVVYSDCDENLHMNNTQYPGVFCNCLPDMKGRRVTGFSISYQNEARLGDTFTVLSAQEGDSHLFRTILSDGSVGAEALMTLGSL